jgi:hypothetical protein
MFIIHFTTASSCKLMQSPPVYDFIFLRASEPIGLSPRLKLAVMVSALQIVGCRMDVPSASSHALPAPNPVPSKTGHALRLNRRTENMTPKPKPRPDRTSREEIARSHCCGLCCQYLMRRSIWACRLRSRKRSQGCRRIRADITRLGRHRGNAAPVVSSGLPFPV